MDELKIDALNPNEAIAKAMKVYLEGSLLPTSEKYVDVRFSIEEKQCETDCLKSI